MSDAPVKKALNEGLMYAESFKNAKNIALFKMVLTKLAKKS